MRGIRRRAEPAEAQHELSSRLRRASATGRTSRTAEDEIEYQFDIFLYAEMDNILGTAAAESPWIALLTTSYTNLLTTEHLAGSAMATYPALTLRESSEWKGKPTTSLSSRSKCHQIQDNG